MERGIESLWPSVEKIAKSTGYRLIVLDYPLAPAVTSVEIRALCVQFVRHMAQLYPIMVVCGLSAGGSLALHVTLECPRIIKAVVLYYPNVTYLHTPSHVSNQSIRLNLLDYASDTW
jgi:acetyl esterase/lipase